MAESVWTLESRSNIWVAAMWGGDNVEAVEEVEEIQCEKEILLLSDTIQARLMWFSFQLL